MYYKIVQNFGHENGDRWQDYLAWRGLNLTDFDSVDGILRPDLFEPNCDRDWKNCVNENFKVNLIENLDYAKEILHRYVNAVLVGVEIELERGYAPKERLLGFDILDSYCHVSLITNWGTDAEGLMKGWMMSNGLIGDLFKALEIRDLLRKKFPEDPHAQNCQVWAIYRIDA